MKKVLMFLSLLLLLTACSNDKRYRIGVSQCSRDDWRLLLNDELNREVLYHNNIDLEILSADASSEKQIEDLDYFMKNKFDVVLVCPNEASELTPKIKELYDKGIPIVLFDRNTTEHCYSGYIRADNYGIGGQAADYVLNHLGTSMRILELYGYGGSLPAVGRSEGFHNKMAMAGAEGSVVKQVIGNWKYEDAYRAVDSLLSTGFRFDVLYAHNDRMAIGAADAIKKHGLRDKVTIIGVDGAPRIGIQAVRDSLIDVTFFYPTAGSLLMETAINLIQDPSYTIDTILPSPNAVTHENAETILMVNSQLEGETRRLADLKRALTDYLKVQSRNDDVEYYGIIIGALALVIVILIVRIIVMARKNKKKLELMERDYKYQMVQLELELQKLTGGDESYGEEIK